MSAKPRIAVVGTGWWSTEFHIPSLKKYQDCELVALIDPNGEKLKKAQDMFGIPSGYASVTEALAEIKLDGAIIATPSAMHYPVTKELLENGVHVMVEKPFTIFASEAYEIVNLAKAKSLHLTIGYTFQHTNAAKALKQALDNQEIGEILLVNGLFASMAEAYYRGVPEQYKGIFNWAITGPDPQTFSDPKLAGGGQGQTQVSHAIGMILHAINQRATQVVAFMENRDLNVDLVDAMAFTCEANIIGNLGSTGNLRDGDKHQQEFRYYGTKGYILHDMRNGQLLVRNDKGNQYEISGEDIGDIYPALNTSRHLVDLITGKAKINLAPGLQAAWAVEFLEAAYKSASTNSIVKVKPNIRSGK
ncbi:MAG: Gfo/Idh/MocA family oxidoreductase [Actinobacteria bacterium]|nr:Gfo/Idh/MocA family oxidoreductase [Actinomycetota bacterium]